MITAPDFRYEDASHEYFLGDERIPSITQLLKLGGLVDDRFYTEDSRRRGTEVHELCAGWEMGACDPLTVASDRRPYLLGYIAAVAALKPTWDAIEEADAHPTFRFAGRTDRVGFALNQQTVAEIKSGAKDASHPIQTALQAILASARWPLPAEHWQRLCIYVKPSGKFSVEMHTDRRDFDVAMRLIKEFCQ